MGGKTGKLSKGMTAALGGAVIAGSTMVPGGLPALAKSMAKSSHKQAKGAAETDKMKREAVGMLKGVQREVGDRGRR